MPFENPDMSSPPDESGSLEGMEHFDTAVSISRIAATLRARADTVESGLREIPFEDIEADPGERFWAFATSPEVVFELEKTVRTLIPNEWSRLYSSEYNERHGLVQAVDSANGLAFIGHLISYDPIAKKVWIYNRERQTRLRYNYGIDVFRDTLGNQDQE
jgi:hypothetical protein